MEIDKEIWEWIMTKARLYFYKQEERKKEILRKRCFVIDKPNISI